MRIITLAAVAFALAPVLVHAAPITGGDTVVQVTADLAGFGLTPSLTGTATAKSTSPLVVDFPITGGALDRKLAGGILHVGSGVRLNRGGDVFTLSNFTIDTIKQTIFANLGFNDTFFAQQAPVFSFNLASVSVAQLTDLTSSMLALDFTSTAAKALETSFGLNVDLTGAQFGLAATAPKLGTVPEPAAFVLFGLGAAMLGLVGNRRA